MQASRPQLMCTSRKFRRACGQQLTRGRAQFWRSSDRLCQNLKLERVPIGRSEQCKCLKRMAPQVGLEPTTLRLTAGCSAIELLRSVVMRDCRYQ
jgi:hypothetical protein